jgi:hypothetical protein
MQLSPTPPTVVLYTTTHASESAGNRRRGLMTWKRWNGHNNGASAGRRLEKGEIGIQRGGAGGNAVFVLGAAHGFRPAPGLARASCSLHTLLLLPYCYLSLPPTPSSSLHYRIIVVIASIMRHSASSDLFSERLLPWPMRRIPALVRLVMIYIQKYREPRFNVRLFPCA